MQEMLSDMWRMSAIQSFGAAQILFDGNFYRDCVSRCYYAAYKACTSACIVHGDASKFPVGWNNPSHEQLPALIKANANIELSARRQIARQLRYLRVARGDADYRPGRTVIKATARDCLRATVTVLKMLGVEHDGSN